jgi:hypothetical protein
VHETLFYVINLSFSSAKWFVWSNSDLFFALRVAVCCNFLPLYQPNEHFLIFGALHSTMAGHGNFFEKEM